LCFVAAALLQRCASVLTAAASLLRQVLWLWLALLAAVFSCAAWLAIWGFFLWVAASWQRCFCGCSLFVASTLVSLTTFALAGLSRLLLQL
jgi:hypothetical protein